MRPPVSGRGVFNLSPGRIMAVAVPKGTSMVLSDLISIRHTKAAGLRMIPAGRQHSIHILATRCRVLSSPRRNKADGCTARSGTRCGRSGFPRRHTDTESRT
jgi:hypothetical protein